MSAEETCSNCGEIDCNCTVCPHCEDTVYDNEICSLCNNCTSCCLCFICPSCGDRHLEEDSNECSNCHRCIYCCECRTCTECGNSVDEVCDICNCCEDCCLDWNNCEENEEIYYKGSLNPIPYRISILNRSRRLIGIELETSNFPRCNYTDSAIRNYIKDIDGSIVSDGSINGIEIVLPPSCGDTFIKIVKEACKRAEKDDLKTNKLCGMHVHLDGRDFNWYDLRKLLWLYILVERGLYSICAKSRQNSDMCKYIKNVDELLKGLKKRKTPHNNKVFFLKEVWKTSLYYNKDEKDDLKNGKYHSSRYNGLNFHSWLYRGTFEFRMHQGTLDAEKIINWALICNSVVDAAYSLSCADLENIQRTLLEYEDVKLIACIEKFSIGSWVILKWIVNKYVKNPKLVDQIITWMDQRREKFNPIDKSLDTPEMMLNLRNKLNTFI